jgi:hypothetical protein
MGYSSDEAFIEVDMVKTVTEFYELDEDGELTFDFKAATNAGVKDEYLDRVRDDFAKVREYEKSKQKSKSLSDGPIRSDQGPGGGGGDACGWDNYYTYDSEQGTSFGYIGLDHCNTNTLIDYLAIGTGASFVAGWISRKTGFPVGIVLSGVTSWIINTYRVEIARADVGNGVMFYYRYSVSGYVIPYSQ